MNWELLKDLGLAGFVALYIWSMFDNEKKKRYARKLSRENAFMQGALWAGYTGSQEALHDAAKKY